jgi:hypothetical protein
VQAEAETKQRNRQITATGEIVSSETVAERAHSLWEREDRPEGRDNEFWFRAEAELKNERSTHLKF